MSEKKKIIILKFKRQNSWPCSVKENTDDNEIYEMEIEESDTYIKNGVRYYDMICGHGTYITLPVI